MILLKTVSALEKCFLDDDIYAEIICDSLAIHVKPDMIKSLFGMISGFSIKRTATMVKGIFTKEDLLEINAKLNKIKKK